MAYSRETTHFRIPYMGFGDYMTEEENDLQMAVIDNALRSLSIGYGSCLVKEGAYSVSYDASGSSYSVSVTGIPESGGYAVCGILHQRYFYRIEPIKLDGLKPSQTHYIYLHYNELMDHDPSQVEVIHDTEEKKADDFHLLLCTLKAGADGQYELDTETGKERSRNIYHHMDARVNPHGGRLVQDDLEVRGTLMAHGTDIPGVEFHAATTAGPDTDVTVNAGEGKTIVFATAYPEELRAGSFSWKIDPSKKSVAFRNSGEQGIRFNIRLDVR